MFTTDDEASRFGCRMRGRVVRKCLVKMSDRGNTSDDSRDRLDGIRIISYSFRGAESCFSLPIVRVALLCNVHIYRVTLVVWH